MGARVLTTWNILLVSENKQQAILHFAIRKDSVKFLPRFIYPISIVAVHHEDQPLRSGVIMSPKRPDLILSADVLYERGNVSKTAQTLVVWKKYGERTHTLNLTFLYVTVSTLKPTVGIVVTD